MKGKEKPTDEAIRLVGGLLAWPRGGSREKPQTSRDDSLGVVVGVVEVVVGAEVRAKGETSQRVVMTRWGSSLVLERWWLGLAVVRGGRKRRYLPTSRDDSLGVVVGVEEVEKPPNEPSRLVGGRCWCCRGGGWRGQPLEVGGEG